MRVEKSFFFAAVIVGSILLLPIVGFVLTSLWPQRVLVSWLLFSLVVLVILVKLTLWVIKAGTVAKIRLSEEALRPGRLYAHERLIEDGGPYRDGWSGQRQQAVMDEPYIQRPYEYESPRRVPVPDETQYVPYSGLKPLSIDSYDWDKEK
jgi:hypothetical protein